MPSPVQQRLTTLLEHHGISVYRYPSNRDMYAFLEILGLMERKTRIKNVDRQLHFKPYDLLITVVSRPPNTRWGHRVYVQCDCGEQVPYGRLHQHKCKG
jgi:hypothetical protein